MKKYRVVSPDNASVTEIERQNRLLAREAAKEGCVLLYNNGALPIHGNKAALFGTGARMTVFGGTGSGDTKGRAKVNIEQGLENAGVTIESKLWLDEFDAKYKAARKAWKDEVEESIKGYHLWNVTDMFREIDKHPFVFPIGQMIEERHITGEAGTAVYIIARQAGEGGDRKLAEGDYLLSETESESIRFLKGKYGKVIVLLNCGGSMDCSFMDDEGLRPDALLYIGQPGEETGNAVADLLMGKCSPSGRLTSTWAGNYADFPHASEYAYMAPDSKSIDYKEGIYAGYRWFGAKGIKPRFPFGYGLSYTGFESRLIGMEQCGSRLKFEISVRNAGKRYSGKNVVQLYVSKPCDRMAQPVKELIGFEKTKLLSAGEEENLNVYVSLYDLTSFYEGTGEEILLKGDYHIYMGESCADAAIIACLQVREDKVLKKCRNIASCRQEFTEDEIPYTRTDEIDSNVITYEVNTAELAVKAIDYTREPPASNAKAADVIRKLSDKELCTVLAGGPVVSYGYNRTPGAVGRTTNELWKKYGIPNINMADGPAGLNLIPQSLITKGGLEKSFRHLPEAWSFGFLPKLEKIAVGNPDKDLMVCQFATAFPSTSVRAQTWNKTLIKEVGIAVGKEMRAFGVSLWLAPAINIQKNPLCGRNFEYASEDPLLSGYMAASIINGVQSVGGVGVTVKHFCANNQETEREYMSANIKERALREIYLKGFEIAIREGRPWAVMSSYNKLNGIYTGNHRELLHDILRAEWGFDGLVMTDWGAITGQKGEYHKCAGSGNDLIMPGSKGVVKQLIKDLKEGRLDRRAAQKSAEHIISAVLNSSVAKGDR